MQAAVEEGVFAESEAWAERERELLAQSQAATERAAALDAELEKLNKQAAAQQEQVLTEAVKGLSLCPEAKSSPARDASAEV